MYISHNPSTMNIHSHSNSTLNSTTIHADNVQKQNYSTDNFTLEAFQLAMLLHQNSSNSSKVIRTPTSNNATSDHYVDNYEYDYEDSVNNIPLEELVPNALAYGLMLIIGMVGNLLVITSISRYRGMHNVTNIFFLSLASADLLLVTVCVPVKFARFFTFTWEYGEILCKAVHYFQNLTIICSVFNLIGLSFERYYAILHPMRAKYLCTVTIARRLVCLIWTMSVIMALPILIGQRQRLVGLERKVYWCVEDWDSPVTAKVYNLYMLVIAFVLPLVLMTFAYTSICRRLWQVKYQHPTLRATQSYLRPDKDRSSREETLEVRNFLRSSTIHRGKISPVNEDSTRKQVVKMLVFVVVLFAVCWGPIMFNNVLVAFSVLQPLHQGYLKPMRQSFWLMGYVNSCLNPIVYGFMSKNFRQSFRNTVRMCVLGSSTRDITRHRTLWRCSFQANAGLQVIRSSTQRSPTVQEISLTDQFQAIEKRKPSVSSQRSTQITP